MISVNLDEVKVTEIMKSEIQKHLAELERQQTFWDSDDLKKHVRMSWNTIQDTFFHDPGFPKVKIGGKWLYPAKETEQFLLDWLKRKREEGR